jgi:hypothetical protein
MALHLNGMLVSLARLVRDPVVVAYAGFIDTSWIGQVIDPCIA